MKNITVKNLLVLGLLFLSGFIQAEVPGQRINESDYYVFFELKGDEDAIVDINKNLPINKVFMQSHVIKNLQSRGSIEKTGDGTQENPFKLSEIPFDNFELFIRWIDGFFTIDTLDFYEALSLAQLVDYFDLINISLDVDGLTDEEKIGLQEAHESLNELIIDLGKYLQMNKKRIDNEDKYIQDICNPIIEYYQEKQINRLSFDEELYLLTNTRVIEDKIDNFAYNYHKNNNIYDNFYFNKSGFKRDFKDQKIINLEKDLLSKGLLDKDTYVFDIFYGGGWLDSPLKVLIKVLKQEEDDTLDLIEIKNIAINQPLGSLGYKYFFVGFLDTLTGTITLFE